MKSTRSFVVRLGTFALAMLIALFGVLHTIARPVSGETSTYTALFTDANGLRTGNDVRVYGVRVGKVGEIELDGPLAKVTFTLDSQYPVFTDTKIAVRYQNLTGQRYLDIKQPERPGARNDPSETIATGQTIPSFDVTTLFNGLQPVLADLTPADLNKFATSILAVIEGDGDGFGPALDAVGVLSRYAVDRQAVISTLIRNLSLVGDHLGNKSDNAVELLTQVTLAFEALRDKVDALVDFAVTVTPILRPLNSLLATAGLTDDPNPALQSLLDRALLDPTQLLTILEQLPAVVQGLTALISPTKAGVNLSCSNGTVDTPALLQTFIGGQRIVLCDG